MKGILLVALGTLVGSSAMAQSLSVEDILHDYNAVTSGNLQSNQEIEGRVYVNGDLTGSNLNLGFGSLPDGTDTLLYVNGQTKVSGIHAQGGNVYLNDSDGVSTTIEKQGNPLSVYVNGSFSGVDNSRVVQSNQGDLSAFAPKVDFDGVSAYSTYLAGLSGASYDGSSFSVLDNAVQSEGYDWDASSVTVYSTSFKALQSGSFKTDLTAGSGQTIIINVSGTSGTFGLNASVNDVSIAGQILWNFYEATDVTVNTKIVGSVLAPNATMSGFGGSTEGSVLAKAINLTNGELHVQPFVGDLPSNIPTSVPEIGAEGAAGALALVLGAMAVMTGRRRRLA